jgi:hypothetical protein
MAPERRYSEDEVSRILDDATEVQATGTPSASGTDGMTLTELQDIGREVGIPEDVIAQAASRLDIAPVVSSPHRTFLGAPIGVGHTIQLDRALTDSEWDRLVVDLRETFDARGRVQTQGAFRQWTNGNLQALLEPTESGAQLRLKTVKGNAIASLGMGVAVIATTPLLAASILLGGALEVRDLMTIMLVAVVGAVLYGGNRLRLPVWADTRQSQMAAVAARLASQINVPAENDAE